MEDSRKLNKWHLIKDSLKLPANSSKKFASKVERRSYAEPV